MYSCQTSADPLPLCQKNVDKDWGSITVIDDFKTDITRTCTRKVHVRADCEISSQCDKKFVQCWTVLEGSAQLTLGWELKFIQFGDSVQIPSNVRYSLHADKDLWMMQVLTGTVGAERGK